MFQIRSIAIRLILAISLTVAAACAILGTFSVMQERSLMRLALDQQLKLQYDSVIATLDYEGRAGLAVSAVLANMPPVADAIAKGDREALEPLLKAPLEAIKAQGIPLISFHTPPATDFYRAHDPKHFGEDISARRNTVVESNKTGKPIVGVEAGRDFAEHFRDDPDHARRQERRALRISASPSTSSSSTASSGVSASTSPCIASTARLLPISDRASRKNRSRATEN